jgi:hypothetical protein
MAYVTSVERLAKQEGQAEMLIRAVERRFHLSIPEEVLAKIRSASDSAVLERWLDLAFEASSLEEFQQRMQS